MIKQPKKSYFVKNAMKQGMLESVLTVPHQSKGKVGCIGKELEEMEGMG